MIVDGAHVSNQRPAPKAPITDLARPASRAKRWEEETGV
jgi:hypothetical protein